MTLEEALSKWLEAVLEREISTVKGSSSVSSELIDLTQMNKWLTESIFSINCTFESKRESAEMTRDIVSRFSTLISNNGINSAFIETVTASRVKNPSQWEYEIVVRIRHRSWFEWQLSL